jgi:hypothetical protein
MMPQRRVRHHLLYQPLSITSNRRPARTSSRQDELVLYLQELPDDRQGLMEYWKSREKD